MGINKTELFTPGELAALFNISKQALLFYNRHNLLVPEYIAENGYRYYSLKQYFQLEIIVNLRKLDFSINDIKKYLEKKSLETLHIAITTQEKKCELEIRRLQNLKKTLQQADNVLDSIKSIQPSQISLGYQEEKYILTSDDLDDDMLSKDRLMIMMQHNRRAYSKKDFKKRTTGWILNNQKFLDGKYYYTDRCFTEISTVYYNTPNQFLQDFCRIIYILFSKPDLQRLPAFFTYSLLQIKEVNGIVNRMPKLPITACKISTTTISLFSRYSNE